jgi:hypothetical protein
MVKDIGTHFKHQPDNNDDDSISSRQNVSQRYLDVASRVIY